MMSAMMLVNVIMGIGTYLYTLDHVNPSATIIAFCKIRVYVLQSSSMMYRWCLVGACFDRYASSSTNVHLRNLATIKLARRVIIGIVATWLVLPVHILICFNLQAGQCSPACGFGVALYQSLFTVIGGSILPVLILATCSMLTYRNLVQKRKRRHVNTTQHRTNEVERVQRQRDQQVLVMLLIQILVYIVTQTPLMILNFYSTVTIYVTNKTVDRISIERFISFLVEIMTYLFGVSAFCLYTMTSRTFRDELIRMLCFGHRGICFKNTRRVEPFTNDVSLRRTGEQKHRITVMSQSIVSHRVMLGRPTGNDHARKVDQIQEENIGQVSTQ